MYSLENQLLINLKLFMTKVLLVRHATTDSVGKRLSGRIAGVYLNEAGRKQADNLAEQLKGLLIAAVYSSSLERAVETADTIAKALDLKTVIKDDFLEINFGEWTNLTFQELDNNPQFKRFNSFRSFARILGGESMPEAQVRMIKGIEELCQVHPGESVVIVSHSDLIKATIAYYSGISLDMFQRIEISPASVSIVEIGEDYAAIKLVNYTGAIRI
jgi:probable phosphoglycerate mutase